MRTTALLLLLSAAAVSQSVTFGIKGGIPFIDPAGPTADSSKLAAGGSVEVRLPAGFAVEASAVYRRINQTYFYLPSPGVIPFGVFNQAKGNSWEFPVIGKYYFRPRHTRWQPYLGAGWALRTIGYTFDGVSMSLPDTGGIHAQPFHYHYRPGGANGAVAAAGVRIPSGRFAFTPELRFTHWQAQGMAYRRNDPGLYLGFTF